jgi:hypothetical protein
VVANVIRVIHQRSRHVYMYSCPDDASASFAVMVRIDRKCRSS